MSDETHVPAAPASTPCAPSPCVSVVMPCYDEQPTVATVLRRVLDSPYTAEVVCIDDGSTDGTAAEIDRVRLEPGGDRIRLLRQDRNRGKGAALRLGFRAARAPFVIVQDADLEYNPDEYEIVLGPLLDGKADVVYGSRFHSSHPHRVLYYWHSMGNKLLTTASNMSTNLNLTDMETCYKAFRREVIQAIDIEEDRFGFEPEITAKVAATRARIYEVGISYDGRTYDEGKKIGWRDGVHALYCIGRYSPVLQRARRERSARRPDVADAGDARGPAGSDRDGNGHAGTAELAATLDRLDDAANYADWLGDLIAPHVRGRTVEVGAGVGTITSRLRRHADAVVAVEPAGALCAELRGRFAADPGVEVVEGDLASVTGLRGCNSVVLINVLEHIADDRRALEQVRSMLVPGGSLVLYVPAFERLYSDFDRRIGHHRRYHRRELGRLLRSTGFQVDELRYVNSLGFGLWWLGMKVLRQDPATSPATTWYDRGVVPWQRRVEDAVRPPLGQSLLAVATAPAVLD